MSSFQQPITFNDLFFQALERMKTRGDSFVVRVLETAGMVWHKYDAKDGCYTLFKVSNDRTQPLDLAKNSWQSSEQFFSDNGLRASMWLSLRNAQGNVIYFNEKYTPKMQDSGLNVNMITFTQDTVKVPEKQIEEKQSATSKSYWWMWILLIVIVLVVLGLFYILQ